MRTVNESLTVLIERNAILTSDFVTEPYEVAWAREARWFLVLDRAPERGQVRIDTEISPDGLDWCRLGEAASHVTDERVSSWAVRDFGGWLRLHGVVSGQLKGSIHLALKA